MNWKPKRRPVYYKIIKQVFPFLKYGETFLTDLLNYSEHRMRLEIDKIPDSTYREETHSTKGGPPIVTNVTIKGSEMTLDMRESGPQVVEFVNS